MTDSWLNDITVLTAFADVADEARYTPLPDNWLVGLSDVVDSTGAIAEGRYKSVNLAGAGTISAVANALGKRVPLFTFGGDGAHFAIPPEDSPAARDALARVAMWAGRDLDLDLRVGLVSVGDIRAAGHDVRVALWQASGNVRYALFTGGGLEWADEQLRAGTITIEPAPPANDPDLSGLSCQWGPIVPKHGSILSLIVKPAPDAPPAAFARVAARVVQILEDSANLNPVGPDGPEVHWPGQAVELQARLIGHGHATWWRRLRVWITTALMWLVFKLGLPVGRFRPGRYRQEIAANTDFRKYDDGLLMTVDCDPAVADQLRTELAAARDAGIIRYGLHLQDEALMTCVVPSFMDSDHLHFVDGAGGGYAEAARNLRGG